MVTFLFQPKTHIHKHFNFRTRLLISYCWTKTSLSLTSFTVFFTVLQYTFYCSLKSCFLLLIKENIFFFFSIFYYIKVNIYLEDFTPNRYTDKLYFWSDSPICTWHFIAWSTERANFRSSAKITTRIINFIHVHNKENFIQR